MTDIVLNSCITSENVGEIQAMADKAHEWGVNICYSAYSSRRTWLTATTSSSSSEQLATLTRGLDAVEARRNGSGWIVNSSTTLDATRRLLRKTAAPRMQAGLRFSARGDCGTAVCSPAPCSPPLPPRRARPDGRGISPAPIPATRWLRPPSVSTYRRQDLSDRILCGTKRERFLLFQRG